MSVLDQLATDRPVRVSSAITERQALAQTPALRRLIRGPMFTLPISFCHSL